VLEGFARRLTGGLLGGLAGGFLGGLGARATGSALAFATTYALGHAAKRYYAGGRKLSAVELKELFASLVHDARGLEARHGADIAASARSAAPAALRALL